MLSSVRIRSGLLAMAVTTLTTSWAVPALQAQVWGVTGGNVSGTVRDASGTPQMGAIVQIMAPDARLITTAITDIRGRYRIANLTPGSYRLRATAALFLPAQKDGLKLQSGSHAIVNLTLSTLFSVSDWLPAQRRAAEEPGDDWMWTLRSAANRPVLRMVGEDDPSELSVSSSSKESRRGAAATSARLAVMSDDGSFAHGGMHQIVTIDRLQADGSTQMLHAQISGVRTPYPVGPSADVTTGIQGKIGLNGFSRTLLTYHSHPELVGHRSSTGLQAATLRSAQRFEFGDTIVVDAGSMVREVNMAGNAFSMLPFVTVSVKPASHVVLSYSYATSPEMQSLDDLDRVEVELPVAYAMQKGLKMEKASHQSITMSAQAGRRTVMEFAVYHNRHDAAHITGMGVLTPDEIEAGGLVADPTTQSFRALTRTFQSQGARVLISQKLTPSLTLAGELESGSALVAGHSANDDIASVLASMTTQDVHAATISLKGRILRSGTRVRASYRWQPESTLTPVDAFHSYGDSAYFSVHLRQPIRLAGILPGGMEAVLDVSNLLAQGYQPFVSSDGRTLYLAQAPRALQAGLAFTF